MLNCLKRSFLLQKIRPLYFLCILILLLQFSLVYAEKVCKFTYKGQPEDLHDSSIIVNEKMVALSEYIPVGSPKDLNIAGESGSIFFIIDHSSSMFMGAGSNDQYGSRFTVTHDLIDSIYHLNPKTEVGLAVFRNHLYFDPTDDPLFKQVPTYDTGAYIPLLVLNKKYNGKTGYQIIQHYLETDTVIGIFDEHVDMVYKPTASILLKTGTNIYSGFEAAKQAMQSSIYPKKNHFIIFFSDGEANKPKDMEGAYIPGIHVPTTFTIYFTPDATAFEDLKEMTKNIQNNGYSLSNPLTDLWTIETGHDTLMNLLMTKVIGKIIKEIMISYPKKITINSKVPVNPWDTTGFTFGDLFPLTGKKTTFVYDIDYLIVVDSITQSGDTIKIKKDTTTHIEYDVVIENGASPLPDTFDVRYWDRTMKFFYNDKEITAADETMEKLEIRFIEKMVDVLYGYNDVTVEMSNVKGKQNDTETFKLSDKGTYFSYTFTRDIDSTPLIGNGKIEHHAFDSIVATFRNPKLILDTLRVSLPFVLNGILSLENAYYFDNDAEGHIDSIFVKIKGEVTNENCDEIVKLMTLPSFRGFTIINVTATKDGIGISVKQNLKNDPITYVKKEDVLTIKHGILSGGGWVVASTISITDKVAPIIHWAPKSALLVDYQDPTISDSLMVRFSEPIEKIKQKEPFTFLDISQNNKTYTVDLESVALKNDIAIFNVVQINNDVEYMQEGDSIWIYIGDRICDNKTNYQNNINNIRRKLWVNRVVANINLIPVVISPFNSNQINKFLIPKTFIKYLTPANVNELEISNNKINNDYTGMLITVKPDNVEKLLKMDDFWLKGNISIYDALGNELLKNKIMGFHKEKKSLVYVWNGKNTNGRSVGMGSYLALFHCEVTSLKLMAEEMHGQNQIKKTYLAIQE